MDIVYASATDVIINVKQDFNQCKMRNVYVLRIFVMQLCSEAMLADFRICWGTSVRGYIYSGFSCVLCFPQPIRGRPFENFNAANERSAF